MATQGFSLVPAVFCDSEGLPEGISTEPMPGNFTTEDYLNTTNPFADGQDPMEEINAIEASTPLNVIVFADEEEMLKMRNHPMEVFAHGRTGQRYK